VFSASKALAPCFGVGQASFYCWNAAYEEHDEAGLVNAITIPKNPAQKDTAIEDATRAGALKICDKKLANVIDFLDHIIDKFRIQETRTDNGHNLARSMYR